jgi:hypothetical protein
LQGLLHLRDLLLGHADFLGAPALLRQAALLARVVERHPRQLIQLLRVLRILLRDGTVLQKCLAALVIVPGVLHIDLRP